MFFLIGNPLSHSFSADYFNDKFCREGIPDFYRLIPIPDIDCLPSLISELMKDGLHPEGFNVTIPYKQSVMKYLDFVSDAAFEIGAVNVVKIIRDGDRYNLMGYNTDAAGFKGSLQPMLCRGMSRSLVLGTGGASKAVAYVLKSLGFDVKKVSRSNGMADLTYGDLTAEIVSGYDVIVNATPLGTYPDIADCPTIPYEGIHAGQICHDLVYNPTITEFMRRAAAQGASVKSGLDMLHIQAEEAWKIWSAK